MPVTRLSRNLLLLVVALFAVSCATAPTTPVQLPPAAAHLVRPMLGHPASPLDERLQRGWSDFQAGRLDRAATRFHELAQRDPAYAPALLGMAAVALAKNDLAAAESYIARARAGATRFAAAEIYAAELLQAKGDTRRALTTYDALLAAPGTTLPPSVAARAEELRTEAFNALFTASTNAADASASVEYLRQALAIRPDATSARVLLVQKLIASRRYDEARRELEPLFSAGMTDENAVQAALAEIDAGQGRFQEAIVRFERLAKRNPADPTYAQRLNDVKRRWNEANLPPQFQQATAAEALTRADLAVLIYWKVAAVRFARNIGEPPIAVDISDVAGRDELIRAIALSFFAVDPVSREVDPARVVTGANFLRIAGRILMLRGMPPCAEGSFEDPTDPLRHEKMLRACGVPVEDIEADSPVNGATASQILERLDAILTSAEQR